MFNPGFSGGFTESAWRAILDAYPDHVLETGECSFLFYLGAERVSVRSVRYRLFQGGRWEEAAWPKMLIRDNQFELLQTALAPWLAQFLREAPASPRFAFDMPVTAADGCPAELRIEVAWNPATGAITSWWLSEHNLATFPPEA